VNEYLSKTAVWFDDQKIDEYNDKSVLVASKEHERSGTLRIPVVDPDRREKGKHPLLLSIVSLPSFEEPNKGDQPETIYQWQRYLTQKAVDSIRRNTQSPEYGELLLELLDDSEFDDH
jgi:hypothetical protein